MAYAAKTVKEAVKPEQLSAKHREVKGPTLLSVQTPSQLPSNSVTFSHVRSTAGVLENGAIRRVPPAVVENKHALCYARTMQALLSQMSFAHKVPARMPHPQSDCAIAMHVHGK